MEKWLELLVSGNEKLENDNLNWDLSPGCFRTILHQAIEEMPQVYVTVYEHHSGMSRDLKYVFSIWSDNPKPDNFTGHPEISENIKIALARSVLYSAFEQERIRSDIRDLESDNNLDVNHRRIETGNELNPSYDLYCFKKSGGSK